MKDTLNYNLRKIQKDEMAKRANDRIEGSKSFEETAKTTIKSSKWKIIEQKSEEQKEDKYQMTENQSWWTKRRVRDWNDKKTNVRISIRQKEPINKTVKKVRNRLKV